MSRVFPGLLTAAFCFALPAAHADDLDGDRYNKPRTQQDIMRERSNACRGLTGQALTECLSNYVGPREKKPPPGIWTRPPAPPKPAGRA
jgi:hypothetical protein